MSPVWDDPRVARGLEAMLELRRARLAAAERRLGWKVAFGAPASLEQLRLEAPLVGFLTDRSLVESGSRVEIGSWTRPVLEPEVAARIGLRAEIAALAPALELADVDRPLDDVEAIVADNIFHRGVVLGEFRAAAGLPAAVDARVLRDGSEHARTNAPEALTGEISVLVRHVAELLESQGESLRADDIVICGSIVPPIAIVPGEHVVFELDPFGRVDVAFRR